MELLDQSCLIYFSVIFLQRENMYMYILVFSASLHNFLPDDSLLSFSKWKAVYWHVAAEDINGVFDKKKTFILSF